MAKFDQIAPFALTGHVIYAPEWGRLEDWKRGAVVVENGKIVGVGEEEALRRERPDLLPEAWRSAPEGERWIIIPGLIDVHAHVPQYPAVARVEAELLPWLQRHIFPRERAFDIGREWLEEELAAFFADVASHGITSAMLYSAVWGESCDMAFAAAEKSGLRISLGKTMMDVGSYGGGAEWPAARTREVSLDEARALIARWHGADAGRLRYVVTPRFAVTCSRELMSAAAELAAGTGCAVQTHLSENHAEINAVAELFPEAASYTDVYRSAGLLGPRSVLGHCVHLSDAEMDMLAESHSKVAHCPTSNFFLNSGLCPIDRLRAHGLEIGLGSDVAGGPELNPWQVMRSAIETQKARRFHNPAVPELTPAQAFFLATTGGARVIDAESNVGKLEKGFEADLAVLDLNAVLPSRGRFSGSGEGETAEDILALLIYRGGAQAVRHALVRGRPVYPVAS